MRKLFLLVLALAATGCASKVTHEVIKLSGGQEVNYIVGKVAGNGQEAVFRDAFVDGKPVISHFSGGQSLSGQVLQGTASSAMIAGGMVGAAAVLRPVRFNSHETNNLDNQQGQGQQQGQAASSASVSSADATATSKNKNSLTAAAVNSNSNSSHAQGGKGGNANAVNSNANKAYGGAGGQGGNAEIGKVNSCNSIGSC